MLLLCSPIDTNILLCFFSRTLPWYVSRPFLLLSSPPLGQYDDNEQQQQCCCHCPHFPPLSSPTPRRCNSCCCTIVVLAHFMTMQTHWLCTPLTHPTSMSMQVCIYAQTISLCMYACMLAHILHPQLSYHQQKRMETQFAFAFSFFFCICL